MPVKFRTSLFACCSLLSLTLLTACSDGGGGAGDASTDGGGSGAGNDSGIAASQAVAPVVGIWDLPDDWRGEANDEAYFVVRTPDTDGVATAIIYDLDDTGPGPGRICFIISGLPGTVEQSFDNRLFLEISEYPTAVVSLTPNENLEIAVFAEEAGSDADPERTLTATRLDGIAEVDLELCDS